jgi:hypothetical protein
VKKNVGWPILKAKVLSNVVYVFVCLNDPTEPPTYYIATPGEIRPRIKEYANRGILNRGALNSEQFLGRWDKIERALASQPIRLSF